MTRKVNFDHLAPDGYFTLASVARSLGITPKALKDNMQRRQMRISRRGKLLIVSIGQLEQYLKDTEKDVPYAAQRPKGWLSTQQAAARVGIDVQNLWKRRADMRVVRYKKRLFWHPDDVEKFRQEFAQTAPVGWYEAAAFAVEHGAHRTTINKWLENNGVESRQYRNANNKMVIYLRPDALCAWLRAYQYSHKINRMNQRTIPAYEQVRRLLASASQPMTQAEMLPLLEGVNKKQLTWTVSKLIKRGEINRYNRNGVKVYSSSKQQKVA